MKILVAVTGGISAYKTPSIISGLKSATKDMKFAERRGDCLSQVGVEVEVMQTENSKNFIPKASLQNIADYYYYMSWNAPVHILASDKASVFVVVPATANVIGKIANGICDDLVTNTAMALREDTIKIFCPACNTRMWENKALIRNCNILIDGGWNIIRPIEGKMACGTTGVGKLAPTREIVEKIVKIYQMRELAKQAKGNRNETA